MRLAARHLGIRPTRGWLLDGALAVVLLVGAEVDIAAQDGWRGPPAFNGLLAACVAIALIWRRSRPLAVLGVAVAATLLQSITYGSSDSPMDFFLVIVAVYSAAAYASPLALVVGLTVAGSAIHSAGDPRLRTFGDAIYDSTMLVLVLLVGLGMRARQAHTRAIEAAQEEREQAVIEEERQRIARELHDIISHSLGVLVLQAGAAERVVDRDPEKAKEVLRSIRATGQQAVGEMGTLLSLVRGDAAGLREPQPKLSQIDGVVEKMREAGTNVQLAVEGQPRELPAALELSAYRILQEGLTNAAKHAPAACVRARVRYTPAAVELEVKDDGRGQQRGLGARRGLAGISERVAVFGGHFQAGAQPGGGWLVRAVLPIGS